MGKSKQAVGVYNKIADSYAKEFPDVSEHIDEFLGMIPENGKILDVGCGNGFDLNYMKEKGFSVIGIDASEGMLKIAKEKFPDIDFRVNDMRELDFEEKFDGLFAAFSLIHIPKKDVPETLVNFRKILKKDGIIYIALQSGKSDEIFLEEPLKPEEKIFLNIFSFEEIQKLLEETGFTILKRYERKPKSKEEFPFIKLFLIARKS